jgi:ABC-type spermidine/putrescine transport system permease subunit I
MPPQETTARVKPGPKPGQIAAVIGVFSAGLAVFVVPVVLGPVGMVLGAYAWARGERRGRWVIVIAIVAMGLGLLGNLLPAKWWT